jgi:hypothetical protein
MKTQIHTDNTVAAGIATDQVKLRCSKTIGMRLYWIRDRGKIPAIAQRSFFPTGHQSFLRVLPRRTPLFLSTSYFGLPCSQGILKSHLKVLGIPFSSPLPAYSNIYSIFVTFDMSQLPIGGLSDDALRSIQFMAVTLDASHSTHPSLQAAD